jgi:hypothetical protein
VQRPEIHYFAYYMVIKSDIFLFLRLYEEFNHSIRMPQVWSREEFCVVETGEIWRGQNKSLPIWAIGREAYERQILKFVLIHKREPLVTKPTYN